MNFYETLKAFLQIPVFQIQSLIHLVFFLFFRIFRNFTWILLLILDFRFFISIYFKTWYSIFIYNENITKKKFCMNYTEKFMFNRIDLQTKDLEIGFLAFYSMWCDHLNSIMCWCHLRKQGLCHTKAKEELWIFLGFSPCKNIIFKKTWS